MSDNLDRHVPGPAVELAARVKKALEADPAANLVETAYGNFYVSAVELKFYGGGDSEIVGYLVPDEGDGSTFDFYTPKRFREDGAA